MDSDQKKYEKLVKRIAANIKAIRTSKGLTQEDMTEYGYSYRHYQRIESGSHSPNLLTLFRLSQTFKVDLKVLLE